MWFIIALCFLLSPSFLHASYDEISGELETIIPYPPNAELVPSYYLLLPNGERKEIENLPRGIKKKHLKLKGKDHGAKFVVEDLGGLLGEGSTSAAWAEPTADSQENRGPLRAVILFVDFQNRQETVLTVDQIRGAAKAALEPWFTEVSYGRMQFTFDVFGKFTLPVDHHCSLNTFLAQAIAAADPIVDFSPYNFIAIVSPTNCGYGGVALLGRTRITTDDGIIQAGYSNNITTEGLTFLYQVIRHEIGHNLGSHHSGFLSCPGRAPITAGWEGCTKQEYGNTYSTMGDVTRDGHYDAAQKYFIGWLDEAEIATAEASGRYTLRAHETVGGLKGVRVRRGIVDYHWIVARSPIGYDAALLGDYADGALVFSLDSTSQDYAGGKPLLLDTTPTGGSSATTTALRPGETFTDPVTGTEITTVSRTGDELVVDVVPGIPDLTAPTISNVSPFSGSKVSGTILVSVDIADDHLHNAIFYTVAPTWIQRAAWTTSPFSTTLDTTSLQNGAAHLCFIARDDVVNETMLCSSIIVDNTEPPPPPPPDTTPPSVPQDLILVERDCRTVRLGWSASTDDVGGSGVKGYRVYRDGTVVTFVTGMTAADGNRTSGIEYAYAVSAVDYAGNESARSEAKSITLSACPLPPVCTITAPLDGQAVQRKTKLAVDVESGGERVDIFDNDRLVCTDPTSPFSCRIYTGANPHLIHILTATCYHQGEATQAAPVTVHNIR